MELTNNAAGVSVGSNGFMDGLSDGAKEVVDKVSDILDIVNKGEGKPFLTAIKEMADKVVDQCRKDAPEEKGWCKVRDSFVLPLAIQGGVAVIKVVIQKAASEKL